MLVRTVQIKYAMYGLFEKKEIVSIITGKERRKIGIIEDRNYRRQEISKIPLMDNISLHVN